MTPLQKCAEEEPRQADFEHVQSKARSMPPATRKRKLALRIGVRAA
jgi:hypothetical protein